MNLKSIIVMALFVLTSGIYDTNSVYAQGVAYPCGPDGAPLLRFLTPQGFMGADFRGSCAQHDACYQIPGISRRYCDLQLRQQLYHRCNYSRFPLGCRMVANTMYLQVRLFGRRTFLNSQYQSPYPVYYGY
ncbi:hypothetical protein [Gimesia aquarii]|uniref:Group XII secretory phospholipase A2 (PLA2G12) n=1 Tax=Gimesia aquarii TaxID=2527964 RepID=A0A517X0U3_9PLAN|nr:hypothetical protein [Gimesia aquarii]QDU11128.1 Group XII secretory phospholipase A2 precursor (PLA2G12) [Gimesia aquarii]